MSHKYIILKVPEDFLERAILKGREKYKDAVSSTTKKLLQKIKGTSVITLSIDPEEKYKNKLKEEKIKRILNYLCKYRSELNNVQEKNPTLKLQIRGQGNYKDTTLKNILDKLGILDRDNITDAEREIIIEELCIEYK